MKFNEAMQKLEQGSKVTRQPWFGSVYFMLEEKEVKSYQPKLAAYTYNEEIMISDGWKVVGEEGEFKFYDIIPYLQKGLKAYMKDWKESYIYLDPTIKGLAIHSMEVFPFTLDFNSFVSEDWVVVT